MWTGAVLSLSIAFAAWYLWPRTRPADPVVEQARATQAKLMANFESTPVKQQVAAMTELRDQMQKMTPEQRREVMEGPGGPRDFMRREAMQYIELPPEERKAFLDKRIDRMQEMFAAMRQMGPPSGGVGGGGGRFEGLSGNRAERERQMLDRTTAQERAMFTEYFGALMKRWQERGLSMPGRP
jgi:hypothetical protein